MGPKCCGRDHEFHPWHFQVGLHKMLSWSPSEPLSVSVCKKQISTNIEGSYVLYVNLLMRTGLLYIPLLKTGKGAGVCLFIQRSFLRDSALKGTQQGTRMLFCCDSFCFWSNPTTTTQVCRMTLETWLHQHGTLCCNQTPAWESGTRVAGLVTQIFYFKVALIIYYYNWRCNSFIPAVSEGNSGQWNATWWCFCSLFSLMRKRSWLNNWPGISCASCFPNNNQKCTKQAVAST